MFDLIVEQYDFVGVAPELYMVDVVALLYSLLFVVAFDVVDTLVYNFVVVVVASFVVVHLNIQFDLQLE